MLDIKFIRDNLDIVKAGADKKHTAVDFDRLLALDDERRKLGQEVEHQQAEKNRVSAEIAGTNDEIVREQLIAKMRELKTKLQSREEILKKVLKKWQTLMLKVPQVPDISVPEGKTDADNLELRTWGKRTQFDFKPLDHTELMTKKGLADFERGTKVHGFRGYYLLGDGARLSWAIWNYAQDFFLKRDFVPMLPPTIVRKENLYGTGHLPSEAEDIYKTQDDDYLIGTSEISGMGMYSDEILSHNELPKKILAFSPCYRREAGSHGRDVKGLIRVHEFYKVEQIVICKASHEESVKWHEELQRNTEEFIESLAIPYRTVLNCGGDLGQGQVKKYDIELWVPLENTYREISSASYFHDFQTRRFNIRYKDEVGKNRYAHSLNCTAIPTPRILVSLLENFQQADGSIVVPAVLQPYLGKDRL